MRLAIGTALIGVVAFGAHAFAQSPMETTGTWLTEDGRAKIRIEHCVDNNVKLCGFVAWMKDPVNEKGQPRLDIHNPDPNKRTRPSLGLELMTGLEKDEDSAYAGEIYNADNGKMYAVTLAVEKADELHVKGCMLKFLCGSQTWTRVADVAVPPTATKVVSTAPAGKTGKPAAHLHEQPAQ